MSRIFRRMSPTATRSVEQLCLVLGEVAYLHVVAHLEAAGEGYLAHDAFHERRLTLAVLAHEGHLLAAADGERATVEHPVLAVGLAHVLQYQREIAGARCRREAQAQMRRVHLVHLYALYLGQLFHAALHLHGLGGLVAEALNELLRVGYLLLLVLISAHLLLDAFLPKRHEVAVVHGVVVNLAERYFDGAVGHIVDESAVVAHEHHGLGLGGKEVFEPLY